MASRISFPYIVFNDPSGNPLVDGYVLLRLNTDAMSPEGQLCGSLVARIDLDGTGTMNPVPQVWSNSDLLPSGSLYLLSAYTSEGEFVFSMSIGVECMCDGAVLLNPGPGVNQTITQQDETAFKVIAPLIEYQSLAGTDGQGGEIVLLSNNATAQELSGNTVISASSGTQFVEPVVGQSQTGNVTITADSFYKSPSSGLIALRATALEGGDPAGSIVLAALSTGNPDTSIGTGDVSLIANSSVSSTLNQGRIALSATNAVYLVDGTHQYFFGGPGATDYAALTAPAGPLTGFGVFDFSNMPLDGSNAVLIVPNTSGELGVIAGSTGGGNLPKFDPTGKWLVDSGIPAGSGTSGSFTSADGKTITVTNGIVTSIV